jgi:hypothetical protein
MDREHAAREVVCVVRSSVGSVFPRSSPAHATTPRSHIAEMSYPSLNLLLTLRDSGDQDAIDDRARLSRSCTPHRTFIESVIPRREACLGSGLGGRLYSSSYVSGRKGVPVAM